MPESRGGGLLAELIELFGSLGAALLDVLRAEVEALGADLKRSGVHLGRAVALFAGAAGVLFWTLGIMVLALIALLAIWLPVWASALIVAGLFAATAGLLIFLGVRQLRQLENPVDDVQRRVADHLDWWQNRLLAEPVATIPPAAGAERPRIHPDDPLEDDEL